jgi:hypothetical protein
MPEGPEHPGRPGDQPQDLAAREEALRALDTRHAHSARVYDYWLLRRLRKP